MTESFLRTFKAVIDPALVPDQLNDPFDSNPPEIAKIAAWELQQTFGSDKSLPIAIETVSTINQTKGKMFGVLVVRDAKNQLGYLIAFSGKKTAEIPDLNFVPSVFDDNDDHTFINEGMRELTQISLQIKALETAKDSTAEIEALKNYRKEKSNALQRELFSRYQFLNHKKETASLLDIFSITKHPNPPAAAGDCAAPKLLHYAFKHNLKPIAIAEFWWGPSPQSQIRKQGEFYAACEDKCRPVLGFMLAK